MQSYSRSILLLMDGIQMKDAWLSSCTSNIHDFVERSTRLQADKLTLRLLEKIDFKYQIRLNLNFRVESKTENTAGKVPYTPNTLVFSDAFKFSQALKEETRVVLSRPENLKEAHELVLTQRYGCIKRDTVIYSHPKKLCLTENCDVCKGKGEVTCSSCGGSGTKNCSSCGGSGQILEHRTVYDHYSKSNRTESYYSHCCSCSGGKVSCSSCAGSGEQQCSPCNGTGLITKITRLNAVTIPEYQLIYYSADVQQFIKDGLYKAGIPNLEKYSTISLNISQIHNETNRVTFLYNAETPYARFSSPLPQSQNSGKQVIWVIYGKNPEILDSGHVIELMLKNDLDNLVYSATRKKLFNPFIGSASANAVCTFMESEAHQMMLDANRSGKTGNMLRETLHRGFSLTYIDEALKSLKSIISAIQNWSVFKWVIFASLMVYILMPLFTAYKNLWFNHGNGRAYLTPRTFLETPDYIFISIRNIISSCGIFILIIGILIPLAGYMWRRNWIKFKAGKSLEKWAVSLNILRSRWLISLIMVIIFSISLLLFFPIWTTKDGLLFGEFQCLNLLEWIMNLAKSLRA
ncbi:DnaJ-like cysteine-rich domain-containing protein [Escherichia coli]